jgi:ribosomal protein S18 acetylase RimI-like enzyme
MPIRPVFAADLLTLFDPLESGLSRRAETALARGGRAWLAEQDGQLHGLAITDAAQASVLAWQACAGAVGQEGLRQLLRVAEQWLFAQGCDEIWLDLHADSAAAAVECLRPLGWGDVGSQVDGHRRFAKRAPYAVRPMQPSDVPAVLALQAQAYADHAFYPEPPGVYLDRLTLAPDLCLVAVDANGQLLGYLVSHPWHEGAPPSLHAQLGQLPPHADCWYLHDCAVSRAAHGRGVAAVLYEAASGHAARRGLQRAALVAVGDAAGYWARWGYVVQERPELAAKLASYGPEARYMARAL